MDYLVAIILGFTEGATEFIPISSSGHLIIVRELLGVNTTSGLAFDAVLQLAATLAIVVYFWEDLVRVFTHLKENKVLVSAIVIGTIPAVVFGLLLESYMESVFRNAKLVAVTLVLGSILFWVADKVSQKNKELTLGRGVFIGFFQVLALVPGISRSGATISGGLIAGLTQEEAVRFSFLLSLPVLLGAGLKKLFEVQTELFTTSFGGPILIGSITAFIVGLLSINFLIKYLKNHNLSLFIWYRVALAGIIFLFI